MTDENEAVSELVRLMGLFFQAVSFQPGSAPTYNKLHSLFLPNALLIKNTQQPPEISNVSQFIEPRQKLFDSGVLTSFNETELSHLTEVFGNIAHRLSTYAKSGIMNGSAFEAKGIISTQFVLTLAGWKISAMAWDDERPGLTIPTRYIPQ